MKKVKSNVTQDFNTKKGLRMAYADGGLVGKLRDRHAQIDAAVNGPAPAPAPAPAPVAAAPAPAPAPAKPVEKPARVLGVPIGGPVGAGLRKLGFKNGGEIRGPGGPRDDMVPARGPKGEKYQVSNGEYILPKGAVDAMGGPEAVDEFVRQTTGREPGPKMVGNTAYAADGMYEDLRNKATSALRKAVNYTADKVDAAREWANTQPAKPAQAATAPAASAPARMPPKPSMKGVSVAEAGMDDFRAARAPVPDVATQAKSVAGAAKNTVTGMAEQGLRVAGGNVGPAIGTAQGMVEKLPGIAPSTKGVTVADATMNDFAKARAAADPTYRDITARAAANRARVPGTIASQTVNVTPGAAPAAGGGGVGAPPKGPVPPAGAGGLRGALGRFGGWGAAAASLYPVAAAIQNDKDVTSFEDRLYNLIEGKGFRATRPEEVYGAKSDPSFAEAEKRRFDLAQQQGAAEGRNMPGLSPLATQQLLPRGTQVKDTSVSDIKRVNVPGQSPLFTNMNPASAVNGLRKGNIYPEMNMQANLESMARANAIRQQTVDAELARNPGSPSTISDGVFRDAFGKTAAERQEDSDRFDMEMAMKRAGSGPVPIGLRQQWTAAMNNKSEEKRNALNNDTLRRSQDFNYDLGLRRDRADRRGQDMTYGLGMQRDSTDRRGQDIDMGKAVAANRIAVARLGQEMAKTSIESLNNELGMQFGPLDKLTPEDRQRMWTARDRIMHTVNQSGTPWQAIDPGVRNELLSAAASAEMKDVDNATFFKWAMAKIGARDPNFRSRNLGNYQATGIEPGMTGDNVRTGVGPIDADAFRYGREGAGPWNFYGSGSLPSVEGEAAIYELLRRRGGR